MSTYIYLGLISNWYLLNTFLCLFFFPPSLCLHFLISSDWFWFGLLSFLSALSNITCVRFLSIVELHQFLHISLRSLYLIPFMSPINLVIYTKGFYTLVLGGGFGYGGDRKGGGGIRCWPGVW